MAAILFGKRTGMIAGGIGMALFDLIAAQAIAQKAMEKGIGQKIQL